MNWRTTLAGFLTAIFEIGAAIWPSAGTILHALAGLSVGLMGLAAKDATSPPAPLLVGRFREAERRSGSGGRGERGEE